MAGAGRLGSTGRLHLLTVDEPELKIARVTVAGGARQHGSVLDFNYLVASPAGVETHAERMELELFSAAEYRRAFERAGLEVEHDPDGLIGRGLFIGRSPAG